MSPSLIAPLAHGCTTSGPITTVNPEDDLEKYDEKAANLDRLPTLVDGSKAIALSDNDDFPEGGRGWLVVLGAFIYAGLVLGWPLSWGVFQSYYLKHNTFPSASATTLSSLGTVQNGVRAPTTSIVYATFNFDPP